MSETSLHGMNGVLRGHIARVGTAYGGRVISTKRVLADDECLRRLVLGGRITEENLCDALKGYNLFPDSFAWLEDFDDLILSRADAAFFALYGRDPVKHVDFRSDGDYFEICSNLISDWNHYDADLRDLPSNSLQNSAAQEAAGIDMLPTVNPVKISDLTVWMVLAVMLLGLLAFYGATRAGSDKLMAISATGLLIALFASVCVFPPYRCPRCRTKYGKAIPPVCRRCGIRFRTDKATADDLLEDRFSVADQGGSAAFQ